MSFAFTVFSFCLHGRTVSVKGEEIIGQYTTFNGNIIHLILTRHEGRFKSVGRSILMPLFSPMGRSSTAVPVQSSDRESTSFLRPWAKPERYFARRGAWNFLRSLTSGPKTFKDLEPHFRSTATLSRRAKEAVEYGLAEKTVRPTNGRSVYRITSKGKKALKKIETEQT